MDSSSQDFTSNAWQNSVSDSQSSPRYEKPTSPLQNDENWDLPKGESEEFDFDSQKEDDDEVFIPMIPNIMRLPPKP